MPDIASPFMGSVCLSFFVKGKLYANQDTIRMLSKAYALHFGEPELEGEAGEKNLRLLKLLLYSWSLLLLIWIKNIIRSNL